MGTRARRKPPSAALAPRVESLILRIRGHRVMIDADLAEGFVFEVDPAWLDDQGVDRRNYWEFAHDVIGWLFKSQPDLP